MNACRSACFVTSTRCAADLPPDWPISLTTAFIRSALTSATMTIDPSAANRCAIALPSPDPAPVTMATLSFKRMVAFSLLFSGDSLPVKAELCGPDSYSRRGLSLVRLLGARLAKTSADLDTGPLLVKDRDARDVVATLAQLGG